jgi:hypothetical protein
VSQAVTRLTRIGVDVIEHGDIEMRLSQQSAVGTVGWLVAALGMDVVVCLRIVYAL